MFSISFKTLGACALCMSVTCTSALAQNSSPSAEGSGEGNRSGEARGSAATAPIQGGSAASGGRSGPMGDSKAAATPIGRGGAALSHQPDQVGKAKASNSDAQLLRDLASAQWAEIKMAGLATAISGDEATRLYAEKMVEEHYAAMDSLRRLARSLSVILPGGVDTEQAALLRKQALLTGPDFDRAYLQEAGVALHENAHKLVQAASRASSPEIRDYAAMLLPVIGEHGKLAQAMQADPAKALAAVQATRRAGQSVFLAQGAPEPGMAAGGNRGRNPGDQGNASIAGRPAGEAAK